jgi:hypothetical protein
MLGASGVGANFAAAWEWPFLITMGVAAAFVAEALLAVEAEAGAEDEDLAESALLE